MILFVLLKSMMFRLMLLTSFFTFSIGLPLEALLEGNSSSLELRKEKRAAKLIVGGWKASEGEFPYQVALYRNGVRACGGSILSDYWILTAAHCVYGVNARDLYILAGVTNLYDENAITRWIQSVEIHYSYEARMILNDIALLELSLPLNFGYNIKAIGISTRENLAGELATVTGWGREQEDGYPTADLMAVEIPIITNYRCGQYWRTMLDSMVCAMYEEGGRDACKGDSGGPLVIYEDGKPSLVGIVSKGRGCGRPHSPGVYTRVSEFVNWIRDFIG